MVLLSMTILVPIKYVQEHQIDGETRWTGRVELPGHTGLNVLVLRVGGRLMGVRNLCPHRRTVSLERGRLDEAAGILECPSHGWQLEILGPDLMGRPVEVIDGQMFLVLTPTG
jgi:nitrite reductase/ring-hydroxylating ferredoxin subunit